jgi:hypothetical protein
VCPSVTQRSPWTRFADLPAGWRCVRLYSRPGNDLTERFPLIVEACARSCIIRCILAAEQLDILEGSHPASFFFP